MSLRSNLLLLAVLCGFLVSCKTQNGIGESISKQLQSGATRIDMRGAARGFAWDKMYVFAPYTPKSEMCKKIGLSPQQCSEANFRDADEGEFFLVFVHSGVIMHVESFSRKIADFDESDRCAAVPIGIDKAIFRVEHKDRYLLVCD